MKTIGMIGGLSWESSAQYYRLINETVRDRLGGLWSAVSLMHTVNFEEIERFQRLGHWDQAAGVLIDSARRLERGGADFILICSNTMHRMANEVEAAVQIPLLHIADPTAEQIQTQGLTQVGLLGTAFTMEQAFYKDRLREKYGLNVLVPDEADRKTAHRIIYEELVQGRIEASSKAEYVRIMQALVDRGAQGIILGCTEIMLLVGESDTTVPIFDTTTLHALASVDLALQPNTSEG